MNAIKKIGFFSAFIIPALLIAGAYAGQWAYAWPLIFVFVLIPLIDHWMGLDTTNISNDQVHSVANEYYYRFVTFVWTWAQLALIFWACYWVSTRQLSIGEWAAFIIGLSLVTGGIGITVAHELGHKKEKIERWYSQLLLITVCYMHFYIEHNRGHHVQVSTPHDPASSRKNEHFYAFWWRSVSQGYLHAWHLEMDRLIKKGQSAFHRSNDMYLCTFLPLVFGAFLTAGFSWWIGSFAWQVPVLFFSQSFFAFSLLELVNYIEHYGLMRKEISPGKYERVNPLHSWNNSHLISNFFLFQLQRHSDHHANAIKRYQVLNHYDESPQLPAGYPTMILLALVPPLWFKQINPLLENWQQRSEPLLTAK